MLVSLCPVVMVVLFTPSVTQGAVFTSQQTEDVVHFVTSLTQCRGIVGLTLAVVRGNETWTRGFGLADRERGRNVSTSDLFGIGSLTKAFTSALISVFINDTSRFSWDTPVVDILGKDFRFVTDELTREVTLKDILTHRTGLENTDVPLFAGSKLTTAEYARAIRYLQVEKPFRDDYNYNNWMWGLAANVAEAMGGAPWEDLVRTHLLQPLGMTQSRVILEKAMSQEYDSVAKPYVSLGGEAVLSDRAIYRITPKDAAGSIASSAEDMATWMRLLLNKGRTQQGRQLLSEARLREITSPYTTIQAYRRAAWNLVKPQFPVMYATDAYGLGWDIATYGGYPMTWHSGSIYAYTSYIALVPGLQLGVFVSNNGPDGRNASHIIRQIFFHIADLIMGEEPWLNVSNACHYPELWRGASSSSGGTSDDPEYDDCNFDNLDHNVGLYEHPLYGDVDVARNGSEGLYVQYGFLEGQLCRTEDKNVVMFEVVGKMAFVYHPGSSPTHLRLEFSRPLSNGTYQEVTLTVPPSTSRALTFYRHTKDPSSGSGKGDTNGFRLVLTLLVTVTVSLFLS